MIAPRLSILIYHRVLARPDPLLPSLPDVRCFDRQMALLKRCFCVLPLSVAARRLQEGTLPARAACITFDDGYADNAELALPVLRRHGLGATFFIASGYLDGGQMWNDDVIEHVRRQAEGTLEQQRQAIDRLLQRFKYLPFEDRLAEVARLAPPRGRELMMRSHQVRSLLAAGMEIGAHTHRHPILAAMPDAEAQADIAEGKAALEAITQTPVTLFAYPNGKPGVDYTRRHVDMASALGFEAAVSTTAGAAYGGSDVLQLPRFTPWERDRPRFLLRLMENRLHGV
ncbi:polysaccharide deacetylase family protein [Duganella sp. CT11-25]|uniref:polysaccharide deacetylase family protein n=1 Tax=unclassified Duganella TaxID=2636909 RepID=UPI0039B0EDA0